MAACDDDLATAPSDVPVASVDTVRFGTILAGNSSPTYLLKFYNKRKGELRLSSVALRSGGDSGFRMNVDGMNGVEFSNPDLLRISSGDSLFVFVEATFEPNGKGIEEKLDYIDFSCNGTAQTVVLQAYSRDVMRLEAPVIRGSERWLAGQEVQVFDSLVIEAGASLVIEDSVTLYLHDKTDIIVRGSLVCEGTLGRPVTIRGDRTDRMFDNLSYDQLPAQWGMLHVCGTDAEASFTHTDIRGMTGGIVADSCYVTFHSCHLAYSDGALVTSRNSNLKLENSLLTGASGSLLRIYGGWNDIVHCTLANYNYASRIGAESVYLCNVDTASALYTPLHRCTFVNTLVWGSKYNPDVRPEYYQIVEGEDPLGRPLFADSIFTYRFEHCLLRADGFDDDDFRSTIWNRDPEYLDTDPDDYLFDFHLSESSPARAAGAPLDSLGLSLPLDLDGHQRAERPNIGCFE